VIAGPCRDSIAFSTHGRALLSRSHLPLPVLSFRRTGRNFPLQAVHGCRTSWSWILYSTSSFGRFTLRENHQRLIRASDSNAVPNPPTPHPSSISAKIGLCVQTWHVVCFPKLWDKFTLSNAMSLHHSPLPCRRHSLQLWDKASKMLWWNTCELQNRLGDLQFVEPVVWVVLLLTF
jgi:hypothetical protein